MFLFKIFYSGNVSKVEEVNYKAFFSPSKSSEGAGTFSMEIWSVTEMSKRL